MLAVVTRAFFFNSLLMNLCAETPRLPARPESSEKKSKTFQKV